MRQEDFLPDRQEFLVRTPEGQWAFVPPDLPPALDPTWRLLGAVTVAERSLSKLAAIARTLPNPHLLIGSFIRKEAVLSSKIEGTQASFSDLVFFEAGGAIASPLADVQEVANYILSLNHGLARRTELPVCLRLIKEIHAVLMQGVRGQNLAPGEFRRSQVFIGTAGEGVERASFVPPPPGPDLDRALAAFEGYLHQASPLPELVRLALAHYQFEAIHPFMDGNGRIGRLLLTLLLCDWGLLDQPLLYLSAFFERHRQEYYRLLLGVSQAGDWEPWILFFLRGVVEQSNDGVARAHKLQDRWHDYRERLQSSGSSGRALKLVDSLFARPVLSVPQAASELELTYRGAQLVVAKLVEQGILEEVPEEYRQRARLFWAPGIVEIMMDGAE